MIWFLDTNRVLSDHALPANVTDAISTLISSFAAFGLGYSVRPGLDEITVTDASGQPRTGLVSARRAVPADPSALAGTAAGGAAD